MAPSSLPPPEDQSGTRNSAAEYRAEASRGARPERATHRRHGASGTGKSQVVTSLLVNQAWHSASVLFSSRNNHAVRRRRVACQCARSGAAAATPRQGGASCPTRAATHRDPRRSLHAGRCGRLCLAARSSRGDARTLCRGPGADRRGSRLAQPGGRTRAGRRTRAHAISR